MKIIWLAFPLSILPHEIYENMFVKDSGGSTKNKLGLPEVFQKRKHHTKEPWSTTHYFPMKVTFLWKANVPPQRDTLNKTAICGCLHVAGLRGKKRLKQKKG